MKTSISFLKSNKNIIDTVRELEKTDTDLIHVDIMDGKFVDNTTLSIQDTLNLFANSTKPLDIHLMVESPREYIEAFKELNVYNITIHEEIGEDKGELIDLIHSYGFKAGIAINPDTNVEDIEEDLNYIDYVLIMGVEPGLGGQEMLLAMPMKIDILYHMRNEYNYHYEISFDGGVNEDNICVLFDLDIVVSGSFVCMSDDYQSKINELRNI